jgi:hypothetical protein
LLEFWNVSDIEKPRIDAVKEARLKDQIAGGVVLVAFGYPFQPVERCGLVAVRIDRKTFGEVKGKRRGMKAKIADAGFRQKPRREPRRVFALALVYGCGDDPPLVGVTP